MHMYTGAEGKADESLAIMAEVEEIKGKKKTLEAEYRSSLSNDLSSDPPFAAQQQRLRPCKVCGAFLSVYDDNFAKHFESKVHVGFVTVYKNVKQLEVIRIDITAAK